VHCVIVLTGALLCLQGWLHCILYVLFENAMGIVKLWAVIAGVSPPAPPPGGAFIYSWTHLQSIISVVAVSNASLFLPTRNSADHF
jgi:hypothetical protein